MDNFFATTFLCLIAVLALISALADIEATRQLRTRHFRWVSLVRTLRFAHFAATLYLLAFLIAGMFWAPAPMWGMVAVQLAVTGGMLVQFPAIAFGDYCRAWQAGFAPCFVVLMTAANLEGVRGGLQLPKTAAIPALLAAVAFYVMARQRHLQRRARWHS